MPLASRSRRAPPRTSSSSLKRAGETVRVVEFDGGDHWSVASATSRGVRAGSVVMLDVTASNAGANNLAFEVYEAINHASRYVGTLARALPRLVTVSFPKPLDDGSFYQNNVITLAGTDAHDWDNILHEYGHHLQAVFDIADSDGGAAFARTKISAAARAKTRVFASLGARAGRPSLAPCCRQSCGWGARHPWCWRYPLHRQQAERADLRV